MSRTPESAGAPCAAPPTAPERRRQLYSQNERPSIPSTLYRPSSIVPGWGRVIWYAERKGGAMPGYAHSERHGHYQHEEHGFLDSSALAWPGSSGPFDVHPGHHVHMLLYYLASELLSESEVVALISWLDRHVEGCKRLPHEVFHTPIGADLGREGRLTLPSIMLSPSRRTLDLAAHPAWDLPFAVCGLTEFTREPGYTSCARLPRLTCGVKR